MARTPARHDGRTRSVAPLPAGDEVIIWTEEEVPSLRNGRPVPTDIGELIEARGPLTLARHAAEEARRREYQFWLEVLEAYLRDYDLEPYVQAYCVRYIRKLRRRLGIKPPKDADLIREQTRDRVRRHRERKARGRGESS